ncbi:MAG: YlbF family regulator [Aristaeellaceae bacterium]
MRDVMMKAQSLAEAILASDIYKTMHDLEDQVTRDEAATAAISTYMEKRGNVELLLRAPDFDAEKVAAAGQELEEAEKAMDACPMVKDMREAQQRFQEMMDNVNRILRLVITGEVEDGSGGCSGNCASCGGCGH